MDRQVIDKLRAEIEWCKRPDVKKASFMVDVGDLEVLLALALAQRFDSWLTEEYQHAVNVHTADAQRNDYAALAFSGPRWAAFRDVLTQWQALAAVLAPTPKEATGDPFPTTLRDLQHGRDCPKVEHLIGEGYFHGAKEDGPYDVDGVTYCGRCHVWIGALTGEAEKLRQAEFDTLANTAAAVVLPLREGESWRQPELADEPKRRIGVDPHEEK